MQAHGKRFFCRLNNGDYVIQDIASGALDIFYPADRGDTYFIEYGKFRLYFHRHATLLDLIEIKLLKPEAIITPSTVAGCAIAIV